MPSRATSSGTSTYSIARPSASDRSCAICSNVIASGPVSVYARAVVAVAGQRRGRGLAHVARVDVGDLGRARGREQPARVPDRVGVLEQVGHVGARAQQHPRRPGALQVRLDLAVPVVEHERRVDRGRRAGELDDALDAGGCGGVDRRALVLDLRGRVGAGEEHALRAVQRALERVAVGEVADGELDVLAEHVRGTVAVAHERAHGDAALAQRAHDVRADVAGRAGHENVHRIPPPLGGMLALHEKTLAGS